MKLLVVHNHYQQSGGEDEVFAAEVALLRQYCHEVLEYTEDNRRINRMNKLNVVVQTIWSRRSHNKLLQLMYEVRPDMVHFHNMFPLISPSAYYACRKAGVSVVQTLHNYRLICPACTLVRNGRVCEDCLRKTPPWPGMFYRCYHDSLTHTIVVGAMLTIHRWLKTWQKQVDIFIAPTEFSRQKFIEGGLPAEKIAVKPNFIHPDPGISEGNGSYVLFVGRLSREKGVKTLIKAWKQLKGIPLKIVGDGPLLDEVQMSTRTRRFEGVEILGKLAREKVFDLMKGARFIVFPSESYETFGLTLAEAFACGKPVIASRLGVMAEIVEEGRTGLHFTSGDPKDLAIKVEWAWTHDKEMAEMGKEARREYELKYTAERNYKRLMEIYQQAYRE